MFWISDWMCALYLLATLAFYTLCKLRPVQFLLGILRQMNGRLANASMGLYFPISLLDCERILDKGYLYYAVNYYSTSIRLQLRLQQEMVDLIQTSILRCVLHNGDVICFVDLRPHPYFPTHDTGDHNDHSCQRD